MLSCFCLLLCFRRPALSALTRERNSPNCVISSTEITDRRDAQNGGKCLALGGKKWQKFDVADPKHSVQNARKGRPRKIPTSESERESIKAEIKGVYNSLPLFYREAFAEAGEPKYNGFKQPGDLETVKNAFVHFFSGSRSLPELYWRVLKELLEISRPVSAAAKTENTQPENPSEFVLSTKKEMPQWADHRELNLGGKRLNSLSWG